MGIFAKKLLTEPKHHGQMFPRIPVAKMKEISANLEKVIPDNRRSSRSPDRRRMLFVPLRIISFSFLIWACSSLEEPLAQG